MHYIIGTSFTVDSKINRGLYSRYDSVLKPGHTYRLIHLHKNDNDTISYHFIGTDGSKPIVDFISARVADNMIAKYKREQIPDYENIETPDNI